MAKEQNIYDLFLLFDLKLEEDKRMEILAQIQELIRNDGTLIGTHDWGQRELSYPIEKIEHAHYLLVQFSGSVELLDRLSHTLKITDGVIRHRLIKAIGDGHTTPAAISALHEDEFEDEDEAPRGRGRGRGRSR